MVPAHSDLSFFLEECMPGPEKESNRSDLLQLLSNASGRYVPPSSEHIQDDLAFDFDGEASSLDLDFDDDDDDASASSILDDLDDLMEGNAKGDVALFKTKKDKTAEPVKNELPLSFPKEFATSCKAPLRRTDFSNMALYRRS